VGTLIEELEQEASASLRAVQNLIDGMARQRRLYIANGMREAIAAGAEVGDTFSRFKRRPTGNPAKRRKSRFSL
jgi:hypothetical protein